MRNVMAYAGRQGRRVVAAFIAIAFAQDDAEAARTQWRKVADQLRPKSLSSQPSSTKPKPTCSPT
jgi:putative transposase